MIIDSAQRKLSHARPA